MIMVSYSELRQNLKKYCDISAENDEVVLVTNARSNHQDVVMMSLDRFNRYFDKLDSMIGD